MKKEYVFYGMSGLFLVVALFGIGSSAYFFRQYKLSEEQRGVSGNIFSKETETVIAKVKKLVVLPPEEPKIMTVQNVAELKKTQRFFADVEDGDVVLVFENAKKAVVYRPSANLVVNIAPILAGEQASVSGKTAPPSSQGRPLKIAVRNGTEITGLTKKLEDELKAKVQNIVIVEKDNAKRTDYTKTSVIQISSTLDKITIQQVADTLKGNVISLPPDEPKPEADILIIAGKGE
jgi:hypothetical protein